MLEGVRLVDEALAADMEIRGAIVSADLGRTERGEATLANLRARDVEIDEVTPRLLSELADTDTPQGVIAVVRAREWSFDDIDIATVGVVLVIDRVQDPGNVGTLIRTAAALGAGGTIVLKGTADPLNPKTLRGAMGAIFYHRGADVWISGLVAAGGVRVPLFHPSGSRACSGSRRCRASSVRSWTWTRSVELLRAAVEAPATLS